MEPSSASAPQDIGPTVAVVGTNGWRCCLCNTTFQRSFSIEHHMIMNHHPLPQLNAPSTQDGARSTNPGSVGEGQQQVTMAQDGDNTVQATESPREASPSHARSSSESASAVSVCLAKSSHTVTEASNAVIPQAERRCQMQDGNLTVKVESTVAVTQAACTKALPQASSDGCVDENLPVHFPAKFGPQTATPSAQSDHQDTSSMCSASSPEAKVPRIQCSPWSSPWIMNSGSAEEHSKVNPANSSAAGPGPHVNLCPQLAARRSCRPYKRQMCCGQVFESKPEFRQHRRVAHGRRMKTFDCQICGSQYAHKRGLNRHLEEKGSVPFPCTDCPERFHSHLLLEAHRKNCHRPDSGVPDPLPLHEDGGAVGCDHHDAPTTTADSDFHEQIKNDPWECSRCKKHFYDKPEFRRHLAQCGILRCQNGVRLFHCNLCPASFQWMVQFHRHYVNDHKLPSLAEARGSPVHFSPYLGNSPVPSPAPSVTSEINTAMAGVDLNHSSASSITGSSSPLTSIVDLTTDHSPEFGMSELGREEEDGGSGLGSNPLSLTSFTSTSEQLSAEEAVVVSDEDSMGSDSSLASDSEWEMVQGQDGEKGYDTKESEHRGSDARDCHRGRGHRFGMHPPFGYPPPPPHHPPGRPPPPHHPPPWDHPGDPSHHFHFRPPPPPHHHHHHHHHHHRPPRPWPGWGRFCRERGPRFHNPHFNGPGWFSEFSGDECTTDPQAQTPTPASTAGFSATEGVGQTKPSDTSTRTAEQETGGSQGATASQRTRDEDHLEDSAPFRNIPPFFWAGKHREKKLAKKVFYSLLKSSLHGGTVFCCPDCLQMFSGETAFHAHCQEEHPASPQARYYVCFMCHYACTEPVLYNKHIHQHCKEIVQNRGQGRGGGHGQWMMGLGHGMHRMYKMLFKAFGPYGPPFARGQPSWETEKDSNDSDSHKEQFKECPYCQKKFKANSRENFFERHVNAHAGVETYNFKCEECGKTFLEKAKFTAHQASHQSSLFVCHCGKKYQSKTSLTRHQRIHNGERPYKCEVCGEGFIENRELVRHSMVHTGEAPYKCQECGKGFTLQTSLKTHIKKQHPFPSQQVTHRCADCSQTFSDLLELGNHQRVCAGRHRNDAVSDENLRSGRVKQEPSNMDLD